MGLRSEFTSKVQEILGKTWVKFLVHTVPEFFSTIFKVERFKLYPADVDMDKFTRGFPAVNPIELTLGNCYW